MPETSKLDKYVARLEEACGEGRDFIVILKYARREEAIRNILEKCKVGHSFKNVLTKANYKGIELSIFITGKLLLKEVAGRENAKRILEELLS